MKPVPVAVWFFTTGLIVFFAGCALRNNTIIALSALLELISILVFAKRYREEKKGWNLETLSPESNDEKKSDDHGKC